jgi:hypothetical protein
MTTEVKNVEQNQSLENLLKETHETLAANFAQEMLDGKVKSFSIVDLWRMEKSQRSAAISRRWN